MKKFIALLLALTLVMGLAVTASAADSEEPVTLTFWSNDGSTQWMEVWGNAAEAYMAEHPNVTIEVVGIPWDDSAAKLNTAAATDTLPDMAFLAPQNVSLMLAMDKLVDLEPYFAEYEGKDDLSDSHLDFYRNFSPDKPGLWCAPMFGSDQQMWYRTDWLAEAGYDEFPEDWDTWFEAVEAMTTDDHYGYSFRGGAGGWSKLNDFLLSYTNSTEFYDENGQSFYHKDNAVEGVERWIDIYKNGWAPETSISNGYTEMIAEMANGNAAMAWHHLQSEPLLTDVLDVDLIGYGYIPKNAEGNRIKTDEPQGIVMFTNCPEEKRDVAWDYIKFLWSPDQQYNIMNTAGGVPTNLSTPVDDKPFVQAAIAQAADPATKVVVYPAYLPDWSQFINETLAPDLQALMMGEMTAEDAVAKWAEEADAMYADYFG